MFAILCSVGPTNPTFQPVTWRHNLNHTTYSCYWPKWAVPLVSFNIVYTIYGDGLGSSVGIETGYGLNSPGIESWWDEIFCTCPDWPWGPPSLLCNGYRVFPGGKEQPGRDTDPLTPFWCHGRERVELYLYSLYGP
jgi:hypothetical protein